MIPQNLDNLSQSVCCYAKSPCMTLTGISPHITILKEFAKLHSYCKSILSAIVSIPGTTTNIITEELESRAIGARTLTRNSVRVILMDCLAESGLHNLVHQPRNQPSLSQNINCLPDEQQIRFLSHMNFTIPETYQLPQGSPKSIWYNWCLPNNENSIPPVRLLRYTDSLHKRCKKYSLT